MRKDFGRNEPSTTPLKADTASQRSEVLRMDVGGRVVDVPVEDVPESVLATCPEFEIDQERLWNLQLPTQAIRVDAVAWMLELPLWPEHGRPFALRPIDVIRSPAEHTEHAERIQRASLDFPIDTMLYRERIVVLEGCHRTCKAINEGSATISARIVPPTSIPEIVDWNATAPTFDLRQFMKRNYDLDL
jgi:hypothetical protein